MRYVIRGGFGVIRDTLEYSKSLNNGTPGYGSIGPPGYGRIGVRLGLGVVRNNSTPKKLKILFVLYGDNEE